ncbi:hypothetical protein J6590_055142 [Homalodisca vitripennis]|nr:hypothetical protein J6590_055142 [Homalodisca vitripennis]
MTLSIADCVVGVTLVGLLTSNSKPISAVCRQIVFLLSHVGLTRGGRTAPCSLTLALSLLSAASEGEANGVGVEAQAVSAEDGSGKTGQIASLSAQPRATAVCYCVTSGTKNRLSNWCLTPAEGAAVRCSAGKFCPVPFGTVHLKAQAQPFESEQKTPGRKLFIGILVFFSEFML